MKTTKSLLSQSAIVAWGNLFKRFALEAIGITPSSHFRTLAFVLILLAASTGMVQAQPATPAPVPTRLQADVLSVYSNTYSNAFGTVTWSNASEVSISGNATRYANNVNFAQGAYASTSISGMTHLHIDIYTTTANTSKMKIQVGGSVKGPWDTPNGVWTSIDLPLTTWSSPTTNNLINLQGYAGAGTFYFDNIYFYKLSATVPGAPTIGTATAGNTQASVAFTAPASNGGSPITGYTVTSSPGGITATGSSSPIVVTGLTNGTPYTFTVTATNSVGTSNASAASNSVTPIGAVPGAPTIGTATGGNAQASVAFTAPPVRAIFSNNRIYGNFFAGRYYGYGKFKSDSGYRLTNGTSYTFTVTATNSQGTGAPSAASNL
jgi:hypothetical protein